MHAQRSELTVVPPRPTQLFVYVRVNSSLYPDIRQDQVRPAMRRYRDGRDARQRDDQSKEKGPAESISELELTMLRESSVIVQVRKYARRPDRLDYKIGRKALRFP